MAETVQETGAEEKVRREAAVCGMMIAYWAERFPTSLALRSPVADLTFGELNARANQFVRALRSQGVGAGDSVALMCSNRLEFPEVVVGAQRMGVRLTAVNWHLTGEEAGYIVDDCEAKAFIADARFAGAAVAAAKVAAAATVRLAIGGSIAGFVAYDEACDAESAHNIEDPSLGTSMLYTSGTTGRPKGVFRPPSPVETSSSLFASAAYEPGESFHLCTGPLYHAAPLGISLRGPLAAGVGVTLMDGWDAEETLRLVEAHRITHSHMVPTMFHRLISLPEEVRRSYDVSSLRFVMHGAAPCPVAVKQSILDWWGPIVHEYYAATEGSGTVVGPEDWLQRPGTVGKPPSPDHIRIVSSDGMPEGENPLLGSREVGTIYIKAPNSGRFVYFKNEEKTANTYDGDYFTLGDMGYLDEDGYLFLTDRSAHLIISGGVNIYPAEVEEVLLAHPAVGDAGVIGVPNEEWGEEVRAVVELQPGVVQTDALAAELMSFCREHLARYKCPRQVDFVKELPRHDNGKLYKTALRAQYRAAYEEAKKTRE